MKTQIKIKKGKEKWIKKNERNLGRTNSVEKQYNKWEISEWWNKKKERKKWKVIMAKNEKKWFGRIYE